MPDQKKPILTPEQFARNRKLEGIFIPHASRRREKVWAPGQTGAVRFVHYTSAEAGLEIISQKRLWMRNAVCMADYSEIQHGFTILQRFFSDKTKADSFTNAVNEIAQGAAEEAIGNFNNWWQSGTIRFNTFITSVSEHNSQEDVHGRLSMWRAVGGSQSRVAIVFNVPFQSGAVVAMNIQFSPVAYLTDEETGELIPEVIRNVTGNTEFLKAAERREIVNWIFYMLLWGCTCIKHEGFREEREWRAVHCPPLFPSSLVTSSVETVGGVPQRIYMLPLDKAVDGRLDDVDLSKIFDHLIIGPSPYPNVMFDAYIQALSDAGVDEAGKKIRISHIPIR